MIDNNIQIRYCSKRIGSLLKERGFAVLDEQGKEMSEHNIPLDIAIQWVYFNFDIYVWADLIENLNTWRGNYIIVGEISNWLSCYNTMYDATEAALECVLENLVR